MNAYKHFENQPAWLQDYINSPQMQRDLYKRTIFVVMLSQFFGGAGLAAGVTSGALLAQNMLDADSLTGLPMALSTLGSAGAAILVGWISQQFGRRLGLGIGFLIGGIGATGIVIAAAANNIPLFFFSLFIYGSGSIANLQARYAGADLANREERATAASMALVATTFGAVAGPNLADTMGRFAQRIGIPSLAGIFMLAAAAFTLAGIIIFLFMRPDPLIVSMAIAQSRKVSEEKNSANQPVNSSIEKRGIVVGTSILTLVQIIMVMIMTMTPIHMKANGHGLGSVGLVIGVHIGSMYLPYLVTGVIADKIGRKKVVIASGIILIFSAVIAAIAPPSSLPMLIVALALLGLGWNLGLIGSTAIIVDSTVPSNRAKIQGFVDVFIAFAAALSGLGSGFILANYSYSILSFIGCFFAVILLAIMLLPSLYKN